MEKWKRDVGIYRHVWGSHGEALMGLLQMEKYKKEFSKFKSVENRLKITKIKDIF